MKKAFFSFAVAAVAAFAMASCGGNKSEKADATAEAEQPATEQEAEPAEPLKVETRGQMYDVVVPAGWDSKQYASEMIIKKDAKELNFKEQANGNINDWMAKMNEANKQNTVMTGGRTWQVYKNEGNFKVTYLSQFKNAVVRVGSNVENAEDPEVLQVLQGCRDYDQANYQ